MVPTIINTIYRHIQRTPFQIKSILSEQKYVVPTVCYELNRLQKKRFFFLYIYAESLEQFFKKLIITKGFNH